jgi:hypothetical protein
MVNNATAHIINNSTWELAEAFGKFVISSGSWALELIDLNLCDF